MNAIAIKQAAIIAIGKPLRCLFIGSLVIFSLSPLINTIATVKPMPANKPYKTAKPIFIAPALIPISEAIWFVSITSSATPNTAQLVVISGR